VAGRAPTRQASRRLRSEAPSSGWQNPRSGELEILQAEAFAAFPWLLHGFSTRQGGSSRLGGSRVLNLGYARWDNRRTVEANRKRFLEAIDASRMRLVTLHQVHSGIVHVVEGVPEEPLRGDALVSAAPGLLLAVETADCVPILLVDARRRVVAAVHAGWRGTLARIAEKVVGWMRMRFGTDPADVAAAIGPAIGPCCYEVGPEVSQAYCSQFDRAKEWFSEPSGERVNPDGPAGLDWLKKEPPGHERPEPRAHLDLAAANCWQLEASGVPPGKIFSAGLCTACHRDRLFSYRRDGPGTGRMMAVIGLRA
jgi:purine-nucleoside/S-methyl-5'-thioadenosine phosphorylase / adenosine deaminase